VRYDNLKPAVVRILRGRDRVENERVRRVALALRLRLVLLRTGACRGSREGRRRGRGRPLPPHPPGARARGNLVGRAQRVPGRMRGRGRRQIDRRAPRQRRRGLRRRAAGTGPAARRAVRLGAAVRGRRRRQGPSLCPPGVVFGARPLCSRRLRVRLGARIWRCSRRAAIRSWPCTSAACTNTSSCCSSTSRAGAQGPHVPPRSLVGGFGRGSLPAILYSVLRLAIVVGMIEDRRVALKPRRTPMSGSQRERRGRSAWCEPDTPKNQRSSGVNVDSSCVAAPLASTTRRSLIKPCGRWISQGLTPSSGLDAPGANLAIGYNPLPPDRPDLAHSTSTPEGWRKIWALERRRQTCLSRAWLRSFRVF
jgi:hypothetical protein